MRWLSQLLGELGQLGQDLAVADLAAAHAKADYDRAYSVAFRQSSGSVEARRHIATEMCHGRRLAADEAACKVRELNQKIRWTRDRIDVGRSYGAVLRAEAQLTGSPWTEG